MKQIKYKKYFQNTNELSKFSINLSYNTFSLKSLKPYNKSTFYSSRSSIVLCVRLYVIANKGCLLWFYLLQSNFL